ncbi:MAG: SET domain-containing protein [Gammaproteobacteria bacterium]
MRIVAAAMWNQWYVTDFDSPNPPKIVYNPEWTPSNVNDLVSKNGEFRLYDSNDVPYVDVEVVEAFPPKQKKKRSGLAHVNNSKKAHQKQLVEHGVFAARDFMEGEQITEFPTAAQMPMAAPNLEYSMRVFDDGHSPKVIDGVNTMHLLPWPFLADTSRNGRLLYLAHKINEVSCEDANVAVRVVDPLDAGSPIGVFATRDIKDGEELYLYYWREYSKGDKRREQTNELETKGLAQYDVVTVHLLADTLENALHDNSVTDVRGVPYVGTLLYWLINEYHLHFAYCHRSDRMVSKLPSVVRNNDVTSASALLEWRAAQDDVYELRGRVYVRQEVEHGRLTSFLAVTPAANKAFFSQILMPGDVFSVFDVVLPCKSRQEPLRQSPRKEVAQTFDRHHDGIEPAPRTGISLSHDTFSTALQAVADDANIAPYAFFKAAARKAFVSFDAFPRSIQDTALYWRCSRAVHNLACELASDWVGRCLAECCALGSDDYASIPSGGDSLDLVGSVDDNRDGWLLWGCLHHACGMLNATTEGKAIVGNVVANIPLGGPYTAVLTACVTRALSPVNMTCGNLTTQAELLEAVNANYDGTAPPPPHQRRPAKIS